MIVGLLGDQCSSRMACRCVSRTNGDIFRVNELKQLSHRKGVHYLYMVLFQK